MAKIKDQYGTITVYTRTHINGCTHTQPGQNDCSCPKWFYANRKGHKPKQYAAETPSYAEAVAKAKAEHEGWHPEVAKARADAAKQERKKKRIQDAVMENVEERALSARKSTCDGLYSTLGKVEPDGAVRGHFLLWVDEINRGRREDRIEFMDQLDSELLLKFRVWAFKRLPGDSTRKNFWGKMRGFFAWAHQHGYAPSNPLAASKSPKSKKGNRCGAFTDGQFEDILAAIKVYARERYDFGKTQPDDPYRKLLETRLTIITLLMRYSGMAIIDALLFCPFIDTDGLGLDADGVLRYRRYKTHELAVVPIENKQLLKMVAAGIPLERNSDPSRPFAIKGRLPAHNVKTDNYTQTWQRQLKSVYALAGITQIKTEIGFKAPHIHMFRDTFAKWHLSRHTDIRDLSKMLGHATIRTTQESYSSWMAEDQQAMIDRVRSRNSQSNVVRMPSLQRAR